MSREWGKGYVVNTGQNPATPESAELVAEVAAAYTAKKRPGSADPQPYDPVEEMAAEDRRRERGE